MRKTLSSLIAVWIKMRDSNPSRTRVVANCRSQ